MSEFLAEASVLIRPDVTKFRAELIAQLAAATRGVSVPVPVTAISTGQTAALTTATSQAAAQQQVLGAQTEIARQHLRSQQVEIEKTARRMGQLERGAGAAALSVAGLRAQVLAASGPFIAGTVAVTAFTKAISAAASLEQELNVFRITSRATADQIEDVRREAIALGKDISLPAVSAGDAAQAFTELSKAGLDVQDALAGGRGVLQLAIAAQVDFASAAELTANALNAFGLSGEEAIHVADLLANASNEAQGSILDMGLALRQSAAVADQLGLSVDTTVAFITELARAGIQGSDAGTSLRVALTRLIAPTEKAQDIIKRLNIDLRNSQGALRPDVFVQLGKAMEGLGRQEQARILFNIFGQDAQRAAAVLSQDTLPALNDTIAALERQGAAAELAGARSQGFSGRIEALKSNLETLGTTLGTTLLPLLGKLATEANEIVTAVNNIATATLGWVNELKDLNSALNRSVPLLGAFEGRLKDALQTSLEVTTGIAPVKFIGDLASRFSDSSKQIQGDAEQTSKDVQALFESFEQRGGLASTTALNQFVVSLDEMASKMAKGDEEAQRLAAQIRDLIEELQDPQTFRVDIEARLQGFDARGEAQKGGEIVLNTLQSVLSPSAMRAIGLDAMENLGRGLQAGATAAGEIAGEILTQTISTRISVAEAGGDERALLAALRERQQKLRARLEALLAQPQTKEIQQKIQNTADLLAQTNDKIQSILDKQASDAEKAKNEILDARRKADEAILDSFDLREQGLRTSAIEAASTEGVQDDIRANNALRRFFENKRKQIKQTIQDAKTKAQEIAQATQELAQVSATLKDLDRQQQEILRQQRQERLAAQRESLALDIQITQATGNRAAEIRAREAEISFIERQIRQTRKNSLQRKRLIAELREAQKELRDLKNEKKKTNDALAGLMFEFLQTQQGFAANLLGNLIPSGATGGLVGNVSPAPPEIPSVGAAVGATAGVAEARDRGPTRGDAATQIHLLREIKGLLAGILIGTGHPEARFQKRMSGGSFDTM